MHGEKNGAGGPAGLLIPPRLTQGSHRHRLLLTPECGTKASGLPRTSAPGSVPHSCPPQGLACAHPSLARLSDCPAHGRYQDYTQMSIREDSHVPLSQCRQSQPGQHVRVVGTVSAWGLRDSRTWVLTCHSHQDHAKSGPTRPSPNRKMGFNVAPALKKCSSLIPHQTLQVFFSEQQSSKWGQ